jgi:hypothetical protein
MEKTPRFYTPFLLRTAILLLCIPLTLNAQKKNFSKLSAPEKRWVIAHPFIAKKAFVATQRARAVTDSLSRNGVLKDGNGGQLDAFRHAYWMALLVQRVPAKKAEKLGNAHEKGNYLDWKKGLKEDSMRADSMLCVMDLQNNATGIKIGKAYANDTAHSKSLEAVIIDNVKRGKMVIIKKNARGEPEDRSGRIIVPEKYIGKWYLPKVLVSSDYTEPLPGKE